MQWSRYLQAEARRKALEVLWLNLDETNKTNPQYDPKTNPQTDPKTSPQNDPKTSPQNDPKNQFKKLNGFTVGLFSFEARLGPEVGASFGPHV